MGVVKAFDVGEQVSPGLFLGGVDAVMDALGFEGVEEALYRGIIPAVAFATHGRGDEGRGQGLTIGLGGVLDAAIRVMEETRAGALPLQGHGHDLQDPRPQASLHQTLYPTHQWQGQFMDESGELFGRGLAGKQGDSPAIAHAQSRGDALVVLDLDAAAAAAIERVPGVEQRGVRAGNWLLKEQASDLLQAPTPPRSRANAIAPSWRCCSAAACAGPSWEGCGSRTSRGGRAAG
jgi:hypothetical protein